MVHIYSDREIKILRESGKRLADVMRRLAETVHPGVRTDELNTLAEALIRKGGDTPAFLGYTPHGARRPYPATLCVSINDAAVHGIPNENPKTLQEGDIVSLDTGLIHDGLISDMCITCPVGDIDTQAQELIAVTRKALAVGIEAAHGGARLGDIGHAIEAYIATTPFTIIEDLGGHGVGHVPHEDPFVAHVGKKGSGIELKPGMVITIEPTISEGINEIELADDEYTYITADGARTAQFEHTIVITNGAPEVLTA